MYVCSSTPRHKPGGKYGQGPAAGSARPGHSDRPARTGTWESVLGGLLSRAQAAFLGVSPSAPRAGPREGAGRPWRAVCAQTRAAGRRRRAPLLRGSLRRVLDLRGLSARPPPLGVIPNLPAHRG